MRSYQVRRSFTKLSLFNSTRPSSRLWQRLSIGLLCLSAPLFAGAQTVDTLISTNLFEPYGIAVDAENTYYITDSANNRVVRVSAASGVVTNLAGLAGPGGAGALDGFGEFARFFSPQGIVTTGSGLIVADSGNHVIRRVGFDGVVETIAGDLSQAPFNAGEADGIGSAAQFNSPAGLAIGPGDVLYVADVLNDAIRKMDLASGAVTTIARGLNHPTAIAVAGDGTIYVADTGNHSIKAFREGEAPRLIAGSNSRFASGLLNAPNGANALFRLPRGLFWAGGKTELLVADSGNGVLRRIFNLAAPAAAVETYSNTGQAGLRTPVGLVRDNNGNYLMVDLDAGQIRIIRISQTVQPPVRDPVIGTVEFVESDFFIGTQITAVTNATFNNNVVVAILAEPGTQTFYTIGPTEQIESLPNPTPSDRSAPPFEVGQLVMPPTIIDPTQPDVTIRAISTQADRRSSAVITSRFRFQVANPAIIGNNPASFRLSTATESAELWYTTGTSDAETPEPGTNAPARLYLQGARLNVANPESNVVFKVRGFKRGYAPSAVIRRVFETNDIQFSTIGMPRTFTAGIGSTIVVPVEVDLALEDEARTLQFRVEVSPKSGSSAGTTPQLSLVPSSSNDFIPVRGPGTNSPTVRVYQMGSTNGISLAYVGNGLSFRLVNKVTVALIAVKIPTDASVGDEYQIAVRHPSGTSDGIQTPLFLATLSPSTIRVENKSYLVGDTATAAWYNVGDFGDGDLKNNDVNNAFFASLGVRTPFPFTDVFDAMDVFPEDSSVRAGGDGQIRFLDWQVILQRSLRLTNVNWLRAWSDGGVRVPDATDLPVSGHTAADEDYAFGPGAVWVRDGLVAGGDLGGVLPGARVSVPVWMVANEGVKLDGMQFRVEVHPVNGAANIAGTVGFKPVPDMPTPYSPGSALTKADIPFSYAAWSVGDLEEPLQGGKLLGYVDFVIPPDAEQGTRYEVRISNADGAGMEERGLVQFDLETLSGSVWVGVAVPEGQKKVSEQWKAHFFPAVDDKALPDADPDSDGMSNYAEYLAGTDPSDAGSSLRLSFGSQSGIVILRWLSAPGKSYLLERSPQPSADEWQVLTRVVGDGNVMELSDSANGTPYFYRLKLDSNSSNPVPNL